MRFALHQGDCREIMRGLPECSVDSIVCDPPYELGFMGKGWDRSGVANDPETWRAALRVLKPGGHLLAFSGSRTYHRMVCAIEDAGFEVRDQIMWIYGSGFPKSLDVSKAIDKSLGAEREVIGEQADRWTGKGAVLNFATDRPQSAIPVTGEPATSAPREWQGWGTALKPAHEPICVARKPLIGTVAANVLAHGTGGLNIGACRVEWVSQEDQAAAAAAAAHRACQPADGVIDFAGRDPATWGAYVSSSDSGRWPANVIHDGSDEVVRAFPDADGQQGAEPSAKTNNVYGDFNGRPATAPRNDLGSAARFFYAAKASKEDRNEGCSAIPAKQYSHDGRGTPIDNAYQRNASNASNAHPTVKPTDLMAYLCRLVTPRGGVVLDPFMGSGSTGKAAMLEGFSFIGIDLSPEYIEIARARIEFALRRGHQPSLELEAA